MISLVSISGVAGQMKRLAFSLCVGYVLSGCTMLPRAGPMANDVIASPAGSGVRQYEIFDISPQVVAAVRHRKAGSFAARFSDTERSVEPTIGVGDTVTVTLWEAPGGILFASNDVTSVPQQNGSHMATVPDQVVGRDGAISVPFAGRVKVSNKTTRDVEAAIKKGLSGKTTDAQVVVNVRGSVSNAVTVIGEVQNASRLPLSVGGDRILDVVAATGGLRVPINETFVELTRGDTIVRMPLLQVTNNPRENIYLRAKDVLTLVRAPQKFLVYGATGSNAEIPFDADGITLADALAKAGGLNDSRSDPSGIFVFRYESSDVVRAIRPDTLAAPTAPAVPVIYRLDLRDADGFFQAQQFPIMNRDVIYVSNAPFTDVQKVMSVATTMASYAAQGVVIAGK
jgi:polysaccharide export outer membrane protein